MEHSDCRSAINHHRKDPACQSVSKSIDTVQCSRPKNVAMCNWMGNGTRFACLQTPSDSTVPINVYGTPLKGGVSRIVSNKWSAAQLFSREILKRCWRSSMSLSSKLGKEQCGLPDECSQWQACVQFELYRLNCVGMCSSICDVYNDPCLKSERVSAERLHVEFSFVRADFRLVGVHIRWLRVQRVKVIVNRARPGYIIPGLHFIRELTVLKRTNVFRETCVKFDELLMTLDDEFCEIR